MEGGIYGLERWETRNWTQGRNVETGDLGNMDPDPMGSGRIYKYGVGWSVYIQTGALGNLELDSGGRGGERIYKPESWETWVWIPWGREEYIQTGALGNMEPDHGTKYEAGS